MIWLTVAFHYVMAVVLKGMCWGSLIVKAAISLVPLLRIGHCSRDWNLSLTFLNLIQSFELIVLEHEFYKMCVPFYTAKCLPSLLSIAGEKGAIDGLKACFNGMYLSTLERQACEVRRSCIAFYFLPFRAQISIDKLS